MNRIRSDLAQSDDHFLRILPDLLVLRLCKLATQHHEESPRAFAHVDHHPQGVICATPALADEDEDVQLGILWHEVGHIIDDYFVIEPSPEDIREAQRIYPDRTPEQQLEEARANAAVRKAGREILYGPDGCQRVE